MDMDRGSNTGSSKSSSMGSSMDNRGTGSNMVQGGAAPGEEGELQHIDFGYPQ